MNKWNENDVREIFNELDEITDEIMERIIELTK